MSLHLLGCLFARLSVYSLFCLVVVVREDEEKKTGVEN